MNEEGLKSIRQAKAEAVVKAAVGRYGRQFVKREIARAQRAKVYAGTRETAIEVMRYQLAEARTVTKRRKLEARIVRAMEEARGE